MGLSPLDLTFGCYVVGVVLSAVLFGIMSLQAYLYYENYPRDSTWIKWLVGVIWLLDTVQFAGIVHFLYHYTVTLFGQTAGQDDVTWSGSLHIFMSAVIPFMVQMFFLRRVWILGRNYFVCGAIGITAAVGCAFGVANMFWILKNPHFSKLLGFNWGVSIWLVCAPAADLFIAIFLVLALYKSRSGFSETIVKRLIIYSVNTGVLTTIVTILDLACFLAAPGAIHIVFSFMATKLYTNSLLASLNARSSLSGRGRTTTDQGISLPVYRRTAASRTVQTGQSKTALDHITVDVTTTTTREAGLDDTKGQMESGDFQESFTTQTGTHQEKDNSLGKATYGGDYIC